MRHLIAAGILIAIVTALPASAAGDRRQQTRQGLFCTTEFNPVCALVDARTRLRRTFSNRCMAERDGAADIRPGTCEGREGGAR